MEASQNQLRQVEQPISLRSEVELAAWGVDMSLLRQMRRCSPTDRYRTFMGALAFALAVKSARNRA